MWQSIHAPFPDNLDAFMKVNVRRVCNAKRKQEERAQKKAEKENTPPEMPEVLIETEETDYMEETIEETIEVP